MEEKPLTDWDSGLCDCFEDAKTCCYGFWCGICLASTVSRRFGEGSCLPLWDVCCYGSYGCIPPAAVSMRAAMRYKYRIKGSLCEDICISFCCAGLSWCQMHRELKFRKKEPIILNMQSQTVVNMQPAPMMMMPPPVYYPTQPAIVQASPQ
uniref:Uncharacterized protein n=1 Tax=Cyprinodon variegatus TaxID=28743 RepID=A0A3Q2CUR2_CYPVA